MVGRRAEPAANHRSAFKYFGVKPTSVRWSWSGRSPDGRTVAVRLWHDGFEDRGRVYRGLGDDGNGDWKPRPGFVELMRNLARARHHLDGVVSVILLFAKDKDAQPRSIERSSAAPNLKMRVIELDENEGTFLLERVDG